MRALLNSFQDLLSLRPRPLPSTQLHSTQLFSTPLNSALLRSASPDPTSRRSALPHPALVPLSQRQAKTCLPLRRRGGRPSYYLRPLSRVLTGFLLMSITIGATGVPTEAPRRSKAPSNAMAYFIWPLDGTVIHGGRFWVRMGLRNMGVAPRGVDLPNVGHHHLLIDTALPPLDEPIPSDRNHLHFGAGETEARIELPPGTHTLQLLLGDRDHKAHEPPVMSKNISVTVR